MNKLKKQDEYNVGEFVQIEREIEIKPNTINMYRHTGIIVKKRPADWPPAAHEGGWTKINYLISIPEYRGDYIWIEHEDVKGVKTLPFEYKLNMVSNFGEWWYHQHKLLYQDLLVQAIK
jgi:hypothetical protein